MAIQGHQAPAQQRRWYQRRDVRFLIVVAVLIGGYWSWGVITGPSRMSAALKAALGKDAKRLNIVVTTKFAPEQFHLGIYQRMGTIRGTQDNATTVFRVRPHDVRSLSRHYWVERIDLAATPR